MKRFFKITFLSLSSILSTLFLIAYLYRQQDAIDALNFPLESTQVKIISEINFKTKTSEIRTVKEIQLTHKTTNHLANFTVSFPDSIEAQIPVIFILGGLNDGMTYLDLLDKHANNIIVAFHYPNNSPYWEDQISLGNLTSLRESMLAVPFHISMILKWLHDHQDVDQSKINLMTYSLGAIYASSVVHIAKLNNFNFASVSIVYGASDLQALMAANLNFGFLNQSLAWFLSSSIYPLDGSHHIRSIQGQFLLINGELDEKIPITLAQEMHLNFPEKKTIILLPEKHMHPKRKALTKKLIALTLNWHQSLAVINE